MSKANRNPSIEGTHAVLQDISEALDWEGDWRDRVEKIDKQYGKTGRVRSKTLSIYWSIIEVLRAATYQRTPQLVAIPRRGHTTPILRAAADVVEGAVETVIDDKLDPEVRDARDEWLRHGRGVLWVETSPIQIVHVPNLDFVVDHRARSWPTVMWVARRRWWSRDAIRERWPEVPFDAFSFTGEREEAAVWEYWHKPTRMVTMIAEGASEPLEEAPPAVEFPNFFPCPQPLGGMTEPGTMIPVPDVVQYQDQLDEIDKMTSRIIELSESVRVRGFYPAGDGDLGEAVAKAMRSTSDREVLVPVANFQQLGGQALKDSVIWMPIDQIVETIRALQEVRRHVIEDVFQITGVSDIIRGAETEEERTATEVETRAAWGSQRVRERQLELARGVRDALRYVLEAMVSTIQDPVEWNALAGLDLPTIEEQEQAAMIAREYAMANQERAAAGMPPIEPPELPVDLEAVPIEYAFQAIQHRRLLLDIETESTVYAVEEQNKRERMEFVSNVAQLALGTAQAAQLSPSLAKFGIRLIEFASQGWRVGRDFQEAISELEQALAAMPGDPNSQQAGGEPIADFAQRNQIAVQRMGAEAQIEQATGTDVDGGLE